MPCIGLLLGVHAVWILPVAVSAPTLLENPTAPLPGKLSQSGLIEGSGELRKAVGTFYEPAWPLWSNGSAKERRVVLPQGRQIDTSEPNDWHFPVGTIFVKTFSFDTPNGRRPIETRLIRGLEAGWEFAVYEWNESATDASLADISSPKPLELKRPDETLVRHEIPSRLQCRQCHEANGNFIVGLSRMQLEASRAPDGQESELARLGRLELFSDAAPLEGTG